MSFLSLCCVQMQIDVLQAEVVAARAVSNHTGQEIERLAKELSDLSSKFTVRQCALATLHTPHSTLHTLAIPTLSFHCYHFGPSVGPMA